MPALVESPRKAERQGRAAKRRQCHSENSEPTKRRDKERFVAVVPLLTNPRHENIINQRLLTVGMLRNVGVQEIRERAQSLRTDPRYTAARLIEDDKARAQAYSDLRYEYQLTSGLASTLVFKHWRASKWMTEVVDSRAALALGSEILQNINEWLYCRAEYPRMKPALERDVVWGTDMHAGLRVKDDRLVWTGPRGSRKALAIALDWSALSRPRRKHLQGLAIVRVGIKRERVRGRVCYFALLCYEGRPYRNEGYRQAMATRPEGLLAADLGVGDVALVSFERSELVPLLSKVELAEEARLAVKEREAKRALDRSRRAMNPGSFDERGRIIRGRRPRVKSQRGLKLERRLADTQRKRRLHRKQLRTEAAKAAALRGTTLVIEKTRKKGWSNLKHNAKRILLTAPAGFESALRRELGLCGGEIIELPISLALSQYCLCGQKEKKPLETYKIHYCSVCGLGPLQRDLFSSLLALLVGRYLADGGALERLDLSEGPFNTAESRILAERLCTLPAAPPRRAPSLAQQQSSKQEKARKKTKSDPGARANAAAPDSRPRQSSGRRHGLSEDPPDF